MIKHLEFHFVIYFWLSQSHYAAKPYYFVATLAISMPQRAPYLSFYCYSFTVFEVFTYFAFTFLHTFRFSLAISIIPNVFLNPAVQVYSI